jgi:hypothetical protein
MAERAFGSGTVCIARMSRRAGQGAAIRTFGKCLVLPSGEGSTIGLPAAGAEPRRAPGTFPPEDTVIGISVGFCRF